MRFALVSCALVAGCATGDVRDSPPPPSEVFTVNKPHTCVYAQASEHLRGQTSPTGQTITTVPISQRSASLAAGMDWQVDFEAKTPTQTEVRLTEFSSSARASGQGQELMRFLRSAPECPPR